MKTKKAIFNVIKLREYDSEGVNEKLPFFFL